MFIGFGVTNTAWKVVKYGPEKTPYLDTFHAVENVNDPNYVYIQHMALT